MQMNDILNDFKRYILVEVNKLEVNLEIKEVLEYVLISNGKYIRPLLFLCYLEDKNIDCKKYFNVAMGIEMIHTYSLIHDDLPAIDNDDMRRGKISCHKKFGEDVAILAGDMLLSNAFELLIKNDNLEDFKKIRIINETVKCAGTTGMIFGQYMDVKNCVENIEQLDTMHILKTSKMLILPLLLGSIISGDNNETYLKELGQEIGLLYQIQDDYLDVYGDFSELGKTLNKDQKLNKKTYTFYYAKDKIENIMEIKRSKILSEIEKFSDYNNVCETILYILKRER